MLARRQVERRVELERFFELLAAQGLARRHAIAERHVLEGRELARPGAAAEDVGRAQALDGAVEVAVIV